MKVTYELTEREIEILRLIHKNDNHAHFEYNPGGRGPLYNETTNVGIPYEEIGQSDLLVYEFIEEDIGTFHGYTFFVDEGKCKENGINLEED